MIQDISPWRLRIEFEPRRPDAGDFVFDFGTEGLLLKQGEGLSFPTLEEWQALYGEGESPRLIYAFRLEHELEPGREMRFFLTLPGTGASPAAPEGWERLPARALWGYGWGWPAFAGITAFHLHCWYSTRRF